MPSAQIDKTASVPPAPGGENKFAARLIQNIRKYHSEGFMAFPVYIELIEKNGRTAKETVFSLKWQEEPVTLEKALRKAAEGRWNCLAVLTGRGQDLLVLDIDVKNGRNGLDFLRQHAIEIPPDTPKTATPSGGIHFYFAYPENLKGKSTRAFKKYGFDLRGDGGLIFAPPSDLTGDRQYEWKVPLRRQLRKPPDALINLINRLPGMEAENDPAAEKLTGGLTLPGISPKQREVFYELLKKADAAPTGQRSEADFAVVAWGIKIGLSREEIFNQIRTVGKFAEKARGGTPADAPPSTLTENV